MARSDVPITTITTNAFVADAAGDAIDPTNGHVIDLDAAGVPLSRLIIQVEHTTASEKDITIVVGDNPPADAAGVGTVVQAFAAGDSTPVIKLITLESARFAQNDGTVHIDAETGMTGLIRAYAIPLTAG